MDNHLPKICLLADSHDLYDDRIYWKEACSLLKAGYEVHFVLAADKNEKGKTTEGIFFQTVKKDQYSNRYLNYLYKHYGRNGLYNQLFRAAMQTKAEVFHIHDLHVLRLVEKLKSLPNKPKVIYDVHEPYPENILDYDHGQGLHETIRKHYAGYIRHWEKRKAEICDLIITTEENLQKRFNAYFPNKPVEIIYNYTNFKQEDKLETREEKIYDAIYTGGITRLRGAMKILTAIHILKQKLPDFKMLFLGSWFPAELKAQMVSFIEKNQLLNNVELKEAIPYNEVANYYRQSKIGLGIFLPIATHKIILQIKIFEYMNFGLPIVGSNFGHIQNIIQKHQCGLPVDPENPEEIAEALMKLCTDDKLYSRLAENGRSAAFSNYRWDLMEERLTKLYNKLLA